MNLYAYHAQAKILDGYHQADSTVPDVIFDNHQHDLDELAKREDAIATSARHSRWYAVLTGKRFLKGEAVIAKSPHFAMLYASGIIKAPWPLGEPAIARRAWTSMHYANDCLHGGRFFLGEAVIATDPTMAYLYAKDVIKGCWPMGESAMVADPVIWDAYTQMVAIDGWKYYGQTSDSAMDLYPRSDVLRTLYEPIQISSVS